MNIFRHNLNRKKRTYVIIDVKQNQFKLNLKEIMHIKCQINQQQLV